MSLRYSARAQPFLDAIDAAVFGSAAVRDWLIKGTRHAAAYHGAASLHAEQRAERGQPRQPFFCNCWCGRDSRCTCRLAGSRALETDALFIVANAAGRRLAIYIEFKHPGERFSPGQAEGYPLRAACWASGTYRPRSVPPQDDWLCVVFAGDAAVSSPESAAFDRRIGHGEAASAIAGYRS